MVMGRFICLALYSGEEISEYSRGVGMSVTEKNIVV